MKKLNPFKLAVKEKIKDRRGEMLVESIISIVIFSILMLSITSLINTSVQMEKNAASVAEKRQNAINLIVFEEGEPTGELSVKIDFGTTDQGNFTQSGSTTHKGNIYGGEGMMMLAPSE